MDYSIYESYTLPSKGELYPKKINAEIKLRSMTGLEEKKRLSQPKAIYDVMSSVIDDCMIDRDKSSYDMLIGDFQFLMHKLRVVTYGNLYNVTTICPNPACKHIQEDVVDLDKLEVLEYNEEMEKYLTVELPKCGKTVKLRLLTPRIFDQIELRAREIKKRAPDYEGDPRLLLTMEALIETVDGEILSPAQLTKFVENGYMQDLNIIDKSIRKINIGINSICETTCKNCGLTYKYDLPITGEFFGPSID